MWTPFSSACFSYTRKLFIKQGHQSISNRLRTILCAKRLSPHKTSRQCLHIHTNTIETIDRSLVPRLRRHRRCLQWWKWIFHSQVSAMDDCGWESWRGKPRKVVLLLVRFVVALHFLSLFDHFWRVNVQVLYLVLFSRFSFAQSPLKEFKFLSHCAGFQLRIIISSSSSYSSVLRSVVLLIGIGFFPSLIPAISLLLLVRFPSCTLPHSLSSSDCSVPRLFLARCLVFFFVFAVLLLFFFCCFFFRCSHCFFLSVSCHSRSSLSFHLLLYQLDPSL